MLIISILFIISIFSLYNICKIRKLYLSLQPQTRNNGAIAQLVEQRTENPCVPGSIPGGTTFKRLIIKQLLIKSSCFFLYILPCFSTDLATFWAQFENLGELVKNTIFVA